LEDDARTLDNAAAWKPINGYFDVIVHGEIDEITGEFFFRVNGNRLTVQELATLIKSQPNYSGQPIRLISCNSGCNWESGPGAELSNILGVPVMAPNGRPGVYNGQTNVYPPGSINVPQKPSNSWVICLPGKGCTLIK
jgi:hypothetical protein